MAQQTRHNPWLIAITVTLATIMEVLDTSIANVALPHIAGSLGSSQDEATWVITSYLVSNAVVLPVSAYLTTLVGRKRFYMTCVALFGASSLLCGLAPTLPLLLFFRVLQGVGGGGLGPSEQAILADTFPPEKRGQAFAVYGLAVVTAPTIGPTLGGWVTDNYDWRWVFFINIPVAILSLFLTSRLLEDPPHIKRDVAETRRKGFRLDFGGFAFVALCFGCLEVVLDKGQEDDWFGSRFITTFFCLAVFGLIAFIYWELRQVRKKQRPILDLRLFTNRNLAFSFVMMFLIGVMLYATTVLIPLLLQTLMGYTAEKAGLAMSAGGLATMIMMPLVGIMIGKVDARYLVAVGFAAMAGALFHMTSLNLLMSFSYASWLRVYQAAGLAFLFVPINTLAYVGVSREKSNDVSGLINLARNVGGSCGTSLFTSMLARHQQVHQQYLTKHLNGGNPAYAARLSALTQHALSRAASEVDAQHHALAQFYHELHQQASVLSYIDVIQVLAVIALCAIPMTFLLKKLPKGAAAAAH